MDGGLFAEIYKTDNIFGFLAIFVASLFFIIWSKWDSIVKVLTSKKHQKKEVKKIASLISHSIFYKFDDIYRDVIGMRFTTHGKFDGVKTLLLHRLIKEQLYTIKEFLVSLIEDSSMDSLDENEMEARVMGLNNLILKTYNTKAKNIFINEYGILGQDADTMIDAYADFRKKFHRNFENQLAVITRNNDYADNYVKASALLEVVSTSLYSIPAYALIAMNEVNGTFLKYEGKI